jgi:hypothetical protein
MNHDDAKYFLDALEQGGEFVFQTFDDNEQRKKARAKAIGGEVKNLEPGLGDEERKLAIAAIKKRHRDPYAKTLTGSFESVLPKLEALSDQGAGIFVTINHSGTGRRRAEDINRVRAFFVDFDIKNCVREECYSQSLERLKAFPLEPSIIVKAVSGAHPYWLCHDAPLETFTETQKRFIELFGSDASIHNPDRVMRLPTFQHQKNPNAPHLVELTLLEPGRVYSFEEITAALDKALEGRPKREAPPRERPEARQPAASQLRARLSSFPLRYLRKCFLDARLEEDEGLLERVLAEHFDMAPLPDGAHFECRVSASHTSVDSGCILIGDDGKPRYICMGDSCQGKGRPGRHGGVYWTALDLLTLERGMGEAEAIEELYRLAGRTIPKPEKRPREEAKGKEVDTPTTEGNPHGLGQGDVDYLTRGFLAEAEKRFERGESVYPWGFPGIDEAIGGGLYDGLHTLGGGTASGKTALALRIAEKNAREGRPVVIVTYEQSRYELWGRLISTRTGIPLSEIRRGGCEDSPLKHQLERSGAYRDLVTCIAPHLSIIEGHSARGGEQWNVSRIAAHVPSLTAHYGLEPLVILDYLQRMPLQDARGDRRLQIDAVVHALQVELGLGKRTPILAISSLSRGSYGELTTAPLERRLEAWKESGGIEYGVYTGTLLYPLSDDHAGELGLVLPPNKKAIPGSESFRYLVFDLVKNREGDQGLQWILKWFPRKGTSPMKRWRSLTPQTCKLRWARRAGGNRLKNPSALDAEIDRQLAWYCRNFERLQGRSGLLDQAEAHEGISRRSKPGLRNPARD